MAVIVNKQNSNDEISRRINADLKAKMEESQRADGTETDFASDAEYVKGTKKTGRFAWVWVVLVVLAIISVVFIVTPA